MILSSLNFRTSLLVFLISIIGFACVSRYRLDLNLFLEDKKLNAKVTKAEYLELLKFGDIYSDSKLEIGISNCIVLNTSSRSKSVVADGENSPLFSVDENIRCKLYLQIPRHPIVETLELEEKSFVQILGRFEIPAEDKIYEATEGTLLIDSIVDNKQLFGSIEATYSNRLEQVVSFQGKFKVKIVH